MLISPIRGFSTWGRPAFLFLWVPALLLIAVACGASATATSEPGGPTPTAQGALPEATIATPSQDSSPVVPLPPLDTSISSVPLEDILFDTFGSTPARFVRLDEASDELILRLRDAIAPVLNPVYGDGDALPWLGDNDLILGYESGDQAFAYPINILNFHEIVNDTIGGVPVLVTYCPLCFSGVVFSREVDGEVLTFGNTSALYQSDLVMYDHQSGSYWFQVGGEAVVGPRTGARLAPLASATMSWGEWRELHPETRLITGGENGATAFANARYARSFSGGFQDRINDEQFVFPVDEEKLDGRLAAGEIVLTVEVGEAVTAFPLGPAGNAAINSEVGGLPVVVFTKSQGASVGAFSRQVAGRTLSFDYREDEDLFVDRETGTAWNSVGIAERGPLAAERLERVSTRRAFWFSIAISFPGVELYTPNAG